MILPPPISTLLPYTTLFRSLILYLHGGSLRGDDISQMKNLGVAEKAAADPKFPFIVVSPQCHKGEIWTDVDALGSVLDDRKSARLNSIPSQISYAVFCLQIT